MPLDRDDPDSESLELQLAFEADPEAPRGLLLVLNGGPGAPAAPLATLFAERLGADVMAAYRLIAVDVRGTGPTALHCKGLQQAAGASFLAPSGAIARCGETLGPARDAYGTDDVVADLDLVREAFGDDRWTIFAMSYGTFVAQQYAVAYPEQVAALALDSPIPVTGVDPLQLDVVEATRRVLRDACDAFDGCRGDPVADLAAVVRRDGGGPELLELLSAMSSVRPSYDSFLLALRGAAEGDREALDRLLEAYATAGPAEPSTFSTALNIAAGCADQPYPWGRSDAPVPGRQAAVRAAAGRVPASSLAPFDRRTLTGGGTITGCLPWPPSEPSDIALSAGRAGLPDVPVLLLIGDRDLATPMESARSGPAARLPRARIEVVDGAGHVTTAQRERARTSLRRFLLR